MKEDDRIITVKIKIGSTIGWGWKCTQGQDQALQTISITSAKKRTAFSISSWYQHYTGVQVEC